MDAQAPAPDTIRLEDYRPSDYLIDTVDLDFALEPNATRVKAKIAFRPNPDIAKSKAELTLDGEHLKLVSIAIDGRALAKSDYKIKDDKLTLKKVPKAPFTLATEVEIDPEANKALSGLYRSSGNYCTQCEAEGFRRITYFLDRPDVLAVYTVRLEADAKACPVLLSNGNPGKTGKLAGGRHFAIWHDPHPKPAYLFALVGGDLGHITDTFTTASGRKVDLKIYVEHGKEDRAHWAMDSLKRSMRWDEKRYGLEYDLDVFNIVAVSDFNMGAMENKGLNIFNDKLVLASPDTASDGNYEAIESVIAHEYFHNWTGNRITCRDWFQLCLKEGLTVFRDQEFSGDERSIDVQRINDVMGLRSSQFSEDAGPLAHPVRPESYIEINNFYTATVYEKGAELCRMIQSMVGRGGFRKGMDLYFRRHDGEASTVEHFIKCFEDANAVDLAQFMLWYRQAGTPELVCNFTYDANSKTAELTINQSIPPTPGQPKKEPMHIPLRLGLIGANGQEIALELEGSGPLKSDLVEVRKRKEVFRFSNVPSRPVPSLNRGFSAPINLALDLADKDLEFLMVHDGDTFNRWQAGQTLATRRLIEMVDAIRAGDKPKRDQKLAKAFGVSLRDDRLDPAFRAQMMMLPDIGDLAREIRKNVDPDAIHEARQTLRSVIGRTLIDDLKAVYEQMKPRGAYSPDARSAGKRTLRNVALGLMAARGEADDIAAVAQQFAKSKNMTDQMAALGILSRLDQPERDEALAAFEQRWIGDPLVMDKWFMTQAVSPLHSSVERVIALKSHKLFSLQNPNRVRALIGAFAQGNPVAFNRPDGAGYQLVADAVLELDRFNPQVAARMLGAFRSWRTMEAKRRGLARKALQRIADAHGLSKDTYEIVSKTLT